MDYELVIPAGRPFGHLLAQVRPEKVLQPMYLEEFQQDELTQRLSVRGNVAAFSVWQTDAQVKVIEANVAETSGEVTERVRLIGGNYAMRVTFVTVAGVQVCTPMCWEAYGNSDYTKSQLLTEVLPLFRCMDNNSWLFNLALMFPGFHPLDLSDVMALSLAPWCDLEYPEPSGGWPKVIRDY